MRATSKDALLVQHTLEAPLNIYSHTNPSCVWEHLMSDRQECSLSHIQRSLITQHTSNLSCIDIASFVASQMPVGLLCLQDVASGASGERFAACR